MEYTVEEVLRFVEENDVKFVRLAFCDMSGSQRNMAIMAGNLSKAFERGVRFDAGMVVGTLPEDRAEMLLCPDPATLAVLPWRPQQGRVARLFCHLCNSDGTPFQGDVRRLLRRTQLTAAEKGFTFGVGQECEFYLFRTGDDGQPTRTPHDAAGYLDVAPLDKGENIRRDICLTLGEMDITPESSHHERGPGQNEVSFRHSEPVAAADHLLTFKSVVKSMAARNGLYASFMPKPIEGAPGSGMRYYLTVHRQGCNIFDSDEFSGYAESFAAGVRAHMGEMALFLDPLTNSYRRLGGLAAEPDRLIRLCAAKGRDTRLEIRTADPSVNPYIAIDLLIKAGLDGIENDLKPDGRLHMPADLGEAIAAAEGSGFIYGALPGEIVTEALAVAKARWAAHRGASDPMEDDMLEYFQRI